MGTYTLASGTADFDADGIARLSFGPAVFGTSWHVERLVVSSTSSDTQEPTCSVYNSTETPSALLDSTRRGNAAVSETSLDIGHAENILFVFKGGSPGAQATAVLTGEQRRG